MSRVNEWGESLDRTVSRSTAQRGLLVYSMVQGEEIEVTVSSTTRDGVQIDEDRVIRASLVDQRIGKLHVTEDTSSNEGWTNKDVCLGSCILSLEDIEIVRGGLLRGMIALGQGVVVDFSGSHFTADEPTFMMAEYTALSLQDQRIF